MTELDDAISAAYASQGKLQDANKVYRLFLQSDLFLPVKKEVSQNSEEPFIPLHTVIDDKYFILVFDSLERLTYWAQEQITNMDYVIITGRDLIAGINEHVFLILNLGIEFYKEFSPQEIMHLKKIVSKIDQLK